MVESIRRRLGLTSLKYQRLDDLVSAIGMPKEKLCTYCWDGAELCPSCPVRKKKRAAVPSRVGSGRDLSARGNLLVGAGAAELPAKPR